MHWPSFMWGVLATVLLGGLGAAIMGGIGSLGD